MNEWDRIIYLDGKGAENRTPAESAELEWRTIRNSSETSNRVRGYEMAKLSQTIHKCRERNRALHRRLKQYVDRDVTVLSVQQRMDQMMDQVQKLIKRNQALSRRNHELEVLHSIVLDTPHVDIDG